MFYTNFFCKLPQNVACLENMQTWLTLSIYVVLGSFLNQNYLVESLE